MERKECRLFRSDTAYLLYLHQQKIQPNKEELKKKSEKERRIQVYEENCRRNGVFRLSRFSRQIGTSDVDMSNACLNNVELLTILNTIKVLSLSKKFDHTVRHLDLSGSIMCAQSYKHLCKFLRNNCSLLILKLQNCFIQGEIFHAVTASLRTSKVEFLDLGNNGVNDNDCETLSVLLAMNTLKELYLNHNRLETRNFRQVGISLAQSRLEILDLSWNRIRFTGAIEIARGISRNTNLRSLNMSWNGFGFEGCVALSEMLEANNVLTELNLMNNRIHPPALIALIRGLSRNSVLKILNLSMNPIPVSYTCFLLGNILKRSSIQELILKRIVVNDDFLDIVRNVQRTRHVHVEYDRCLSVPSLDQQTLSEEVRAPWLFNLDPLNLLFMLKEKNRAQDFFNKINRDGDDVLSYQEFRELFKKAGIPVSQLVLDKIIEFLDKNKDGNIDLSEFLDGDKRIKKIARGQAKETARRESYTKYSRSFRKAKIDPQTYRLDIENSQ